MFENTWLDRSLQVEYTWFIFYDFIIFSFLSDCLMLRYLHVFQRYRAHHISFLHHFSLQEARGMVPGWALCALGCRKVVGHQLLWEHWLNPSPLGLQVWVWVNLAWHWWINCASILSQSFTQGWITESRVTLFIYRWIQFFTFCKQWPLGFGNSKLFSLYSFPLCVTALEWAG